MIVERIGFVVFGHQSTPARPAAAGPGLCHQPGKGKQQFLLSSLAASFSITQWFEGAEELLGGREGGVVKSAFLAFCLFDSSSHIPLLAEQAVAASFEALNTELCFHQIRLGVQLPLMQNSAALSEWSLVLFFFTPGGRDNCRFYFGRQIFLLLLSLPVIPF